MRTMIDEIETRMVLLYRYLARCGLTRDRALRIVDRAGRPRSVGLACLCLACALVTDAFEMCG